MKPSTASPPLQVLESLAAAAPPLALVDADGVVRWCSAAFARLWPAAAGPAARLSDFLDAACLQGLSAGSAEVTAPDAAGHAASWRLEARPTDDGQRVLHATPLAGLRAAEQRAAHLQERLDLLQELTDTGVFERDAKTLVGTWDHHMYRIWGLPEPPAGTPAPPYEDTRLMIFPDDTRRGAFLGTFSSPGPHSSRVRIRRPDGQVRHLHTRWKVFFDEHGQARRVLGINTDDTPVHELAGRAERLRTELEVALDLGHIALWRHDLATQRIHLDARGAAVAGLPDRAEGVTVEEARARIHPDDVAQVLASAEFTLRTGEPSDMELRYPQPDGRMRHVLLRRALQRGAEGQPLGFVGVMLDVSERVEERRRMLEYARRLETAAEAARVGLWSTDAGSPLPSWNRRMHEIFGLDPQHGPLAMDDWLARCVHEGDRERVRQVTADWWRTGSGTAEVEFRVVRPSDGAVRWVLVRGEMSPSSGDATLRAEGVAIDITEQQQTLRQLRDTVERQKLTTRALGLGTWSSSQGHREIFFDEQMFRLRGVSSPPRRVTREEIASYLHPDDREHVVAGQREWLGDGLPWNHSFRVLWPDGSVHWISSQSAPVLDELGRPDGRIGVNWDSTASQLAAQAMREREVAVAESQAKSQAMSRISHELRTPLNAMLGFTQLLRGETRHLGDERHARWLGHVEDAGRHLLALIDDVLDLTRAQVGELRLERQPVSCASVVAAALSLVGAAAQERGVALERGTVQGVVMTDPVRLRQVLINLLSNAIKYNRPAGKVHISARATPATVVMTVTDTGYGIAPERLQHAFEPFNRLGAESTGVEGVGIGLAIVKVLVEQMDGEVGVRSEVGRGSEFTVTLPAASAQEAALLAGQPEGLAGPASGAAGDRGCVLYIEDNPVNALLVREMLSHRPALSLTIAETGRAGIERARELRPDLVLIDMQLPDIDGHAVFRALRDDPLTARCRCVALSANATPHDVQAALQVGFADYWTKPIEFQRFLERVDGILARGD